MVHAPRQSGKTTSALLLAEALTTEGTYAAVLSSCKPGSVAGSDIERGMRAVVRNLAEECGRQLPENLRPQPPEEFGTIEAESLLSVYLSRWSERCPRPVVLFLDEIDAFEPARNRR